MGPSELIDMQKQIMKEWKIVYLSEEISAWINDRLSEAFQSSIMKSKEIQTNSRKKAAEIILD